MSLVGQKPRNLHTRTQQPCNINGFAISMISSTDVSGWSDEAILREVKEEIGKVRYFGKDLSLLVLINLDC